MSKLRNIKRIMAIAASVALGLSAWSQSGKKAQVVEPSYSWIAMQPLGLHEPSTIDTCFLDYSRRSVPSEAVSSAYATTGNLGAEGINMIFFERPQISEFFFNDAVAPWLPSTSTTKFYNTRIPMTLMSYNFGGTQTNSQERLNAIFSGNINPRAQVGAFMDYLYSKGCYNFQAAKNFSWGASGSYMGDRYEFQGYFNVYNSLNKENGGIVDDRWITDPAAMQGGSTTVDTKAIPTNLTSAHSKVYGTQVMLNHRYKVGYYHEEEINDTTVKRTYIPVSSFILTMKYDEGRHLFLNEASGEAQQFFRHTYLDPTGSRDSTIYRAYTNTVGISLLEGFHKYAKFGLGAYATYQIAKYTQTPDSMPGVVTPTLGVMPLPDGFNVPGQHTENRLWVGGQLTKQHGSILTYEGTAEFGVAGDVVGDVKIDGRVSTKIPMLSDSVNVTGYGRFTNTEAPYLLKNYLSNHFAWQNEFGKERRLRLGGKIHIPQTSTLIDAGVENISNYLYFNDECLPSQYGDNIQVVNVSLSQSFRWRALNWDNRITYQVTSQKDVLPLPSLTIYSNLYFLFKVAKVLSVQMGVDCDYYTKYTGLAYQPATMTFHTQKECEVGGFPFMNAYVNMKLSKTRFYILYSHFNQGLFGSNKYFSLPHYPLNPSRLLMGVSVDFAN